MEPQDKPTPRCGRGRIAGGSSSATARGDPRDRGRRDQMIQEQENLERASHTIPPSACLATPYLEEFDRDYIIEYSKEVIMSVPMIPMLIPCSIMWESRRW